MTGLREGADARLAQLISVPTVTHRLTEEAQKKTQRPAGEARNGAAEKQGLYERFFALLAKLYPLTHERLEREEIGALGVLYRWPGRREDLPPVVLMAHYDVVPAQTPEDWRQHPFTGTVADGFVWGRGALDDKGPLLVIFEAVENLLAQRFTPPRDVYISLGGDEETAGSAAKLIAEEFRRREIVPWLVLDEGGAVVAAPLPGVKATAAMIGVGEKGQATVRLSAAGESGHASAPARHTAASRIARAVARLHPSIFKARTPGTVSAMLSVFARETGGIMRFVYKLLARFPFLCARVFVFLGGEPAALVRTTVAATMLRAGSAANVLPTNAEATLNLRVAPGETVTGTMARIARAIADESVTVEVLEAGEPTAEATVSGPQFALIRDAVKISHPAAIPVPYMMMAATDCRHFHAFTPACYRFAPLAMPEILRATIHGVNERVQTEQLRQGTIFHMQLLRSLEEEK